MVDTHMCIYTHSNVDTRMHTVTPSGAEYCHYQSLLSIVCVCVCVCVRARVCVYVSVCDSSITPTVRSAAR